jgi:hypothetical protein
MHQDGKAKLPATETDEARQPADRHAPAERFAKKTGRLACVAIHFPSSGRLAKAVAVLEAALNRRLAPNDRRHPIRRAARRSGLDRLAFKLVNRGNRREPLAIAQAVRIDDRACSLRHFRDCCDKDTAAAADQKIAGIGSEAVMLYQRPIVGPNLE